VLPIPVSALARGGLPLTGGVLTKLTVKATSGDAKQQPAACDSRLCMLCAITLKRSNCCRDQNARSRGALSCSQDLSICC